MGNGCFKEKELKHELKHELKQIAVTQRGDCKICDKKEAYGYFVKSVREDLSIFICNDCDKY